LPNLEQNFSQTNQKLFSEISALELGLRQEAEAERRAA
jgi:hypothetical protein